MANFLKETLEAITESGHNEQEVMFIGSRDGLYRCNIEEFKKIADFEYNASFGSSKIPTDLIIYFYDKTYITRGEYDGSEWWEYNEPLAYSVDDIHTKLRFIKQDSWVLIAGTHCACGHAKSQYDETCDKCSKS